MSRIIKFRAWDTQTKEMYGWGLIRDTKNLRSLENNEIIFMQYTGLKDKNGKEIFEGDIVEWEGVNGGIPGGKIGGKDIINYDNKEACFKFGNLSFVDDANQFNDNFPSYNEIEVIGNIYENPELLEKPSALREGL